MDKLIEKTIQELDKKFGDRRTYLTEVVYYWNRSFQTEVEQFLTQALREAYEAGKDEVLQIMNGQIPEGKCLCCKEEEKAA